MRYQKRASRHASPKPEKTRSSAKNRRISNRHIEERKTAENCPKEIL